MNLKVVVIGDGGVGKTSFCRAIVTGLPTNLKYVATIGVELTSKTVVNKYQEFKFDFWDTAGPEKYGGLRDVFYVGSQAIIIIFDLSSRITYKNVTQWYRDVTRIAGKDIPIVLLGNKCDLGESERKVKDVQITFYRKHEIPYYEVSARTLENCNLPIKYIMDWYTSHLYFWKQMPNMKALLDCTFKFE